MLHPFPLSSCFHVHHWRKEIDEQTMDKIPHGIASCFFALARLCFCLFFHSLGVPCSPPPPKKEKQTKADCFCFEKEAAVGWRCRSTKQCAFGVTLLEKKWQATGRRKVVVYQRVPFSVSLDKTIQEGGDIPHRTQKHASTDSSINLFQNLPIQAQVVLFGSEQQNKARKRRGRRNGTSVA